MSDAVLAPNKPLVGQGVNTTDLQPPVRMYLRLFNMARGSQWVSHGIWKYLFNGTAFLARLMTQKRASPLARRAHFELKTNGYFLTNCDELGCAEALDQLLPQSSDCAESDARGARLADHRVFDLEPLLADLKDGIDAYCELRTTRWQCGRIAHPQVVTQRRGNANWHVDREDYHVLKVFIFLSDVDEDSGPTEYVQGSNPTGDLSQLTARLALSGMPKGDNLQEYVRPDRVKRFTGPRGTVAVFDARGIHRGGFSNGRAREMAFLTYAAPNWIHPEDAFSAYNAKIFNMPEIQARVDTLWRRIFSRLAWSASIK